MLTPDYDKASLIVCHYHSQIEMRKLGLRMVHHFDQSDKGAEIYILVFLYTVPAPKSIKLETFNYLPFRSIIILYLTFLVPIKELPLLLSTL